MNFSLVNFIPANLKEWILYILVFILISVILLFNAGIKKNQSIINDYVNEVRALKGEAFNLGKENDINVRNN